MISVMMEVTGMWWITRAREWLFAELGRLRITATRENSMTEMRYWFLQIAFVLLASPAALGLLILIRGGFTVPVISLGR
jgi:hypothetical protein